MTIVSYMYIIISLRAAELRAAEAEARLSWVSAFLVHQFFNQIYRLLLRSYLDAALTMGRGQARRLGQTTGGRGGNSEYSRPLSCACHRNDRDATA